MTTEPTAGADAIDRASASFWRASELDSLLRGTQPLTADASFAIPDLTDDEWEAFARALGG